MKFSIDEIARAEKRPVDLFEVVGFADRIPDHNYPIRNLPPIFRLPKQDLFIVPPFRLKGKFIVGGQVAAERDFKEWLDDKIITAFPPYRAREKYSLWVDEEGTLGYEPSKEVRQKCAAFAVKNYRNAREAFDRKNLNHCIDFAEKVLGADIYPYRSYALDLMARAYREMADGCEKLLAKHNEQVARKPRSR